MLLTFVSLASYWLDYEYVSKNSRDDEVSGNAIAHKEAVATLVLLLRKKFFVASSLLTLCLFDAGMHWPCWKEKHDQEQNRRGNWRDSLLFSVAASSSQRRCVAVENLAWQISPSLDFEDQVGIPTCHIHSLAGIGLLFLSEVLSWGFGRRGSEPSPLWSGEIKIVASIGGEREAFLEMPVLELMLCWHSVWPSHLARHLQDLSTGHRPPTSKAVPKKMTTVCPEPGDAIAWKWHGSTRATTVLDD